MTEFAASFRSLSSKHANTSPPERTLVVVSSLGLPDCILFALRREFSSIDVVVRQSIERACEAMDPPVALLLADAAALHEYGEAIAQVRPGLTLPLSPPSPD